MTTYTQASKRACIRPAHNELLTLKLATSEQVVTLNDIGGILDLECVFVQAHTGVELYKRMYHLRGEFTIYAVSADRFPDKHYVVQWSHNLQRFGCSCLEGKTCGGSCKHVARVEEYASREVVNA
jgi:hypothetical protein